MPAAFQAEILDRVTSRCAGAGKPLYMQGEEARGVYGLVSCLVEVNNRPARRRLIAQLPRIRGVVVRRS
jgi:hypothetical protein